VCQVPTSHVAIDVTTAIDPHETTFSVRCLMRLLISQPAEGLWVDFVGQAVDSLSVDGQPVPVAWDGARIDLPVLAPGEHTVEIAARGLYSNSGQGLHRFHDPVDGATYLYTHFEPSDARRAWPVMEQPDIKTRFSLEVTHPRGWTVMSNTRPQADASSRPAPTGTDSGCEVTSFAASAPLPSYLTALTAGPWHRVTGQWTSPSRPGLTIPLSWSCRASLAEHLDATELLDLTRAGLDLYDRAYDYGFPWDSYDSVLVPEYNLGAMENPGCVTFNEDLYLFRGPVTRSQRAGRANTILHEMCHMWFGDLVTPTWWEDTWLKESFADHQGTWAEAEAAGYTEAWVSFASTRKAWAYLEDSRQATTHPIVAQVDDVEAARQAFDGITYAKGAAVLKQLVAHVGQDTFLKAAGLLFERRAYGNASLDDFLRVLSQVSGRDMHDWARAWLHTAGPSVITDELAVQEGHDVAPGPFVGSTDGFQAEQQRDAFLQGDGVFVAGFHPVQVGHRRQHGDVTEVVAFLLELPCRAGEEQPVEGALSFIARDLQQGEILGSHFRDARRFAATLQGAEPAGQRRPEGDGRRLATGVVLAPAVLVGLDSGEQADVAAGGLVAAQVLPDGDDGGQGRPVEHRQAVLAGGLHPGGPGQEGVDDVEAHEDAVGRRRGLLRVLGVGGPPFLYIHAIQSVRSRKAYLAFSRISTTRQRLVADSGRVSANRT